MISVNTRPIASFALELFSLSSTKDDRDTLTTSDAGRSNVYVCISALEFIGTVGDNPAILE